MNQLLYFLVTSIVSKPEKVAITEKEEVGISIFEISLAQDDAKHVIGKGGETIKAIRNLLQINLQAKPFRININA